MLVASKMAESVDGQNASWRPDEKQTTENIELLKSEKRVNTNITDRNLYLAIAMWMELFPDEEQSNRGCFDRGGNSEKSSTINVVSCCNKIGCVLAHPNGRLSTVDRSREGIHGVAGMLVRNHNKLEECEVFVSRRPCSYCVKLLVRSRIRGISYPPIEPELPDKQDQELVEYLFKVGSVTQSVFVPKVKSNLVARVQDELQGQGISSSDFQYFKKTVIQTFWGEEWMRINASTSLDSKVEQIQCELTEFVEWLARIYLPYDKVFKFKSYSGYISLHERTEQRADYFDPENNQYHRRVANHILTLATMTTERTVEPKTGVGAVIVKNGNIVAVGWNDFPAKQIEEEFHQADDGERDTKYPYFIHAEQNALLMRNVTDVTGATVFVTKTPCHECTPLLKAAGVGTVVLANSLEPIREKYRLDYGVFPAELRRGTFVCYERVSV